MDAGEMLDDGEQPSPGNDCTQNQHVHEKFVSSTLENEMGKQETTHKLIGDRTQAEDNICKEVTTRSFVISDHGFLSESTKTVVSLVPEDDPPKDVPQESNKAHKSPSHYSPK